MVNNFTLPGVNDTRDFLEIFQFINNTSSGGLFMPVILLGLFVIMLIGIIGQNKQASRAWLISSFMTTVLAIPLTLVDLLNVRWVYLLIVFMAIGIFWIRLENPPAV